MMGWRGEDKMRKGEEGEKWGDWGLSRRWVQKDLAPTLSASCLKLRGPPLKGLSLASRELSLLGQAGLFASSPSGPTRNGGSRRT